MEMDHTTSPLEGGGDRHADRKTDKERGSVCVYVCVREKGREK